MQVAIDDLRHAILTDPEQFANSEVTPLALFAADGATFTPDVATLNLYLYDNLGNLLAISSAFVDQGDGTYTGSVNTKNQDVVNLFLNQQVAYRVPINIAIADTNRLWAVQFAEMVNNPMVQPPIPPGPSVVYLTTSDFKNLTVPQISDSFDVWLAYLRAVGLILQGN